MLVYRLYSVINIKMSLRAIDGARTRGLDLGKVARYQLRHYRIKRVMGIEPTYPAWKAGVLPLNYTRKVPRTGIEPVTRGFSVLCSTN